MNRQAKAFIAIVAVVGLIGVGYGWMNLPPAESLGAIVVLCTLCGLAQLLATPLFSNSSVSLGSAFAFVSLLLFGPAGAIAANLGAALVHALYPNRRPWYKVVFNVGVLTSSSAAAGGTFYLIGGRWPVSDLVAAAVPAAAAAIVYYLVNTFSVSGVIALTTGKSFVAIFNLNYRFLIFHYLNVAALSLLVVPAYQELGASGLLLFSLPFLMPWASLRRQLEHARAALVTRP